MYPKRHLLSLLTLIAVISTAFGQTITTTPQYPMEGMAVTIEFDLNGTPLEGMSTDMYVHTGVILLNGSSWQHVIGSWGNNNTQPKLTKTGTDKYSLNITPSILEYYGVSSNQHVSQLCFVVRSSDAGTQTGDLFIDVYQSFLSIVISSPDNDALILAGDSKIFAAAAPLADSMFVYINGTKVAAIAGISVEYEISSDDYIQWETNVATASAKNSDGDVVSDDITFTAIPLPDNTVVPENTQDGFTATSESSGILCLTAPQKSFCFAKGSFNNFEIDPEHYMHYDTDAEKFWIELTNLNPDKEYPYYYNIDDTIDVADPYCHKVIDPWNDQYIDDATYPDLIEYPEELDNKMIISTFKINEPEYEWNITEFTPPDDKDLIIYEVHIRDFIAAHNYQTMIDTVGYFRRLGINAIELMPVMEFEGNSSWGYNPSFYFAADKYYGTANKLKEFIDVCHENNIAVILDIVLNHSFGQSPMVQMYWNEQAGEPAANSPWFNPQPKHDYNVGYDFNHESAYTKKFCKDVMRYWIDEFNIDGYRFDLSKGFTQTNSLGNTSLWGQYDSSRIAIWKDYSDAIREYKENAILILEHFADNSEQKVLSNYGFLLWGNLNYNYNEATMGYTNSNFSDISYRKLGWNDPHLVGYMESHDEERLMYKNLQYGNSNSGYDIKEIYTALTRNILAATFFFTIPGPKMIWQFGEIGYDYSIDYNGRTGEKPIRWDYYEKWRRQRLYNAYHALIKLRNENSIFSTDDYEISLSGYNKKIILHEDDNHVVIVGNFNVTASKFAIEFPETGTWYEFFSHDSIVITETSLTIELDAGDIKLYSKERYFDPDLRLGFNSFGVENKNLEIFPNPCSNFLNIIVYLQDKIDLSVYLTKINGTARYGVYNASNLLPGIYEINIDIKEYNIEAGIYILSVIEGREKCTSKKLIII
ncbi:MAG: alpha-amylase family glycosyl hydrolase [Bacteroidales bacterium]|nr:alpha-amylase family glycosyl hydrolase [Bacteroidales bacterium]